MSDTTLNDYERWQLAVAIDTHVNELRVACERDQGTPDGKPGTIGYEQQREYAKLRGKVKPTTT